MAKRDFYATLEVARDASADDLKKAYRKLAMQYHPDRNPGDKQAEARFKEINEAYDCLKDDQKRAAYDRFGHAAFEQGGAGAGGFDFSGAGGLGDIFDQMFGEFMGQRGGAGAAGGRRRTRAGADVQTQLEIDLTQAFAGAKVQVRVPTRVACEACKGSGSADGQRAADTCQTCSGQGKVRAQQGFFVIERTCPTCGGLGRVIRNPCRICQGAGTVQRERALQVTVPPGVEDGTRIRLAGEGEAGGQGAPNGDLYVHVAIRQHPLFHREGAHVFCEVPLRMTQAALGDTIEVPVIDGTREPLRVPPGTQNGAQFRLRGKGFSVLRSAARGDMVVQAKVETPHNLTRRQRELLEEFESEARGHAKGSPEHEGFFAKMKDFFEGRD
jgi:molecular chaperone DnaJ